MGANDPINPRSLEGIARTAAVVRHDQEKRGAPMSQEQAQRFVRDSLNRNDRKTGK